MLKVVFLLGYGRSGSTFLGSVLGEIDGFFYGGELRHLWSRGLVGGWSCGCGRLVTECEVWSEVAPRVLDGRDPREVLRLRNAVLRLRHLRRLTGDAPWPDRDRLADAVGRVYPAIADRTGARVIVDSSKNPLYGALVARLAGIEVTFVHLVRDPRAVAFSWQRRRSAPGAREPEMPRHSAGASARAWVLWNVVGSRVVRGERSVVLRYEDLTTEPRAAVGRILERIGEPDARPPFVGPRSVEVGIHHTVSGNPSRFRTGVVEIAADEEWRTAQRPIDRGVVTAITLPLLGRYGYPLRVAAAPRSA